MSEPRPTAHYHLPGLFEFYDFYRVFLPLFRRHRSYFYDWCDIGSIYGAPADCLWGGGRVGSGTHDPREVLALMQEYDIEARLTFSNSLLRAEHLADPACSELCRLFAASDGPLPAQNIPVALLCLLHHKGTDGFYPAAAGACAAGVSLCRAGFPSEQSLRPAARPSGRI